MNKIIFDYYILSSVIHYVLFLSLLYCTPISTSKEAPVEVSIITKSTKSNVLYQNDTILPTQAKPLIRGHGAGNNTKLKPVDLKNYADKVKSVVDPIFYAMYQEQSGTFSKVYTTEVLLFPDKYGRILSMKVITRSGNPKFDSLALAALRDAGSIPAPPDQLIKEGIIWTFCNGGL